MNSLVLVASAISLVMLYNGSVRAQADDTETGINEESLCYNNNNSSWTWSSFIPTASTVGLNEGDVKYTDKQQQYMIMISRAAGTTPFGIQRAVLDVDYFAPWPNGVVPYVLDSNLNR